MTAGVAMPNAGEDFCYDRLVPTPVLVRRLAAALDGPDGPGGGAQLLVAVSGGPDSTALLAALAELAPERGLRLAAAHVDHGLRGPESAADRERAARLAHALGVPFCWRQAAVAPGPGVEARARRARYAALEALARETGAARIVTGHTRDDQVETVLLRLLRGAGRSGLAGMRACRGLLWRPLLAVTRADVRRFLAERGLDFAVDRSNADLRHVRNRVRRLLVPWLEAEFNPRLGPELAALAARLDDEERFLAAAARARAAALAAGPALAVAVGAEPPALGRRIVHTWLTAQTGRTATAHHVERILDLARDRARGPVAVPGPARVVREGEWLWCRPGREAPAEPFEAPIAPGERVGDPRGRWVLALSAPRPASAEDLAGAGPRRAVFDADALPPTLRVRTPRPGDRVHLAHVGTRKLQDVLVDAHVPREARRGLPLLVGGETVLWVAGVVRSSAALLGPGTRRVVVGTLERA
jgi:tRNA(Ile)-lysidine synthase